MVRKILLSLVFTISLFASGNLVVNLQFDDIVASLNRDDDNVSLDKNDTDNPVGDINDKGYLDGVYKKKCTGGGWFGGSLNCTPYDGAYGYAVYSPGVDNLFGTDSAPQVKMDDSDEAHIGEEDGFTIAILFKPGCQDDTATCMATMARTVAMFNSDKIYPIFYKEEEFGLFYTPKDDGKLIARFYLEDSGDIVEKNISFKLQKDEWNKFLVKYDKDADEYTLVSNCDSRVILKGVGDIQRSDKHLVMASVDSDNTGLTDGFDDIAGLQGLFDEFRIYHRTLDDSEAFDLYNDIMQCTLEQGYFDAYDVWRDVSDRNISTKIVGNDINLTMASLDENNDLTDRDVTLKYRLISSDKLEVTNFLDLEFDNNNEVNVSIKSTDFLTDKYKAYKELLVQFKYCYDKTSKAIVDFDNCENDDDDKYDYNNTISTDKFAFRPDRFFIDSDSVVYTEDKNVSFLTYDTKNNLALIGGNNGDMDVNLTHLNNNCGIKGFKVSLSDGNDTRVISNVGYGDINFTMEETNGSEFAVVDVNDTSETDRFITPYSKVIKVLPYEANITEINITEIGNYTFSNPENNFTKVGLKSALYLTFYSKLGLPAKDFNSTCGVDFNITFNYLKDNVNDVNMTYSFDDTNMTLFNTNNNIEDLNKTFTISRNKVIDGNVTIDYSFNIEKNLSIPHNPVDISFEGVNLDTNFIKDDSNITNSKQDDGNKTIYYGKIEVSDLSTYNSDENVSIFYEIYDFIGKESFVVDAKNSNWKILPMSDSMIEDVNYSNTTLFESNASSVVLNGEQNLLFKYKGNSKPFKTKVHLGVEPYFWVSTFDEAYDAPSASNVDCLTHYCISVTFLGSSKGWVGVSLNNKDTNTTKRTADVNVSSTNSNSNNSNKNFIKVLW
jgi:hypothetical protein